MKNVLRKWYRFFSPKYQKIILEYKVNPLPRYGHGKPPHSLLYHIINKNRSEYYNLLKSFLKYKSSICSIKDSGEENNPNLPTWNNGFLPGLDIIGIYGMIAEHKPSVYFEIGSGNSTKVARKCIADNQLNTKIISLDPFPRTNIDHLSDQVIRKPIEELSDLKIITDSLNENDILFIDNSHGVYPNSDAMICFMEILPYLKKGVIVHIHDIYLPYDYPQFMCDRYYSEQYMLAAFIMSNPERYKTILPNFFISEDKELSGVLSDIWNSLKYKNVEKHGGSYWLRIQ
ncbi:MAG: class I SAM-dependent methyltransferase [Bacteroidota bacterium]